MTTLPKIDIDIKTLSSELKDNYDAEVVTVTGTGDRITISFGNARELRAAELGKLKARALDLGYDVDEDQDSVNMGHFYRPTYYYVLTPRPEEL